MVGSNIVRLLNFLGHTNLLLVDKLGQSPHKWKTLSTLRFSEYLEYDEFCATSWTNRLAGIETVIHHGARSHTTETDAAFLIKNNYRFSQHLAQWAKDNNAKFIYASSAATYGMGDNGMEDRDDVKYLETLRPLNPYGMSKALFDTWMARRGWEGVVGLKYFNVYSGPERHKGEQRSLVCKAYDSLKSGRPIELFRSVREDVKDEDLSRDFLHVSDAAKVAVWFALDPQGRNQSGLYNVGSGKAERFYDLARFTAEAYAKKRGELHPPPNSIYSDRISPKGLISPYVIYIDMPEALRGRYQYYSRANITKLRKAGYTDSFLSLEEGVSRYVGELAREEIL